MELQIYPGHHYCISVLKTDKLLQLNEAHTSNYRLFSCYQQHKPETYINLRPCKLLSWHFRWVLPKFKFSHLLTISVHSPADQKDPGSISQLGKLFFDWAVPSSTHAKNKGAGGVWCCLRKQRQWGRHPSLKCVGLEMWRQYSNVVGLEMWRHQHFTPLQHANATGYKFR